MSITITPDQPSTQPMPVTVTGEIFSTSAFRAIIAHEFRLKPVQVHVATTGQTFTIPAFLRTHWRGKQTLIIGAGFDKTGLIPNIAADDYGTVIETLAQALTTTKVNCLEIRTPQRIPCLNDTADKVELNVDIQPSVATIWQNLSSNTRKNIRRPLKMGFTSVIGLNSQLLDEFYQLYRMSLHDLGSLPHPKAFFMDLMTQCPSQVEIFMGYIDGIPVVSSLNFVSEDEVYGAWSGIHTLYKKHNVFLAMLWQIIEYCGTSGRKTYNLGRSSAGSNPHQFKLKLANRSHKIYYYQLPIAKPSPTVSKVQEAASWLIRHTPEVVMDGLSRVLLHKFY
ncbi:MAG: GNAT family N-acetyltransferase [Candidatus Thiothrix putei]|uniref:GNAT family N-acetyltransferase n=1 Tax=Candidatus Thiothrix putei TaxID=3080811 RepID=A0AA95KKU4_9GAMM|nr:MAG: GNAT family N-acetyltransferase [Candidatus Thiothrix putei]